MLPLKERNEKPKQDSLFLVTWTPISLKFQETHQHCSAILDLFLLQYCAARCWKIRNFDVKTAFLRGSRRDNRVLGVEPPSELREKFQLKENKTCELLKSAYGLVNAPYLWYVELKECLLSLNFQLSPLDPCLFSLVDEHGVVHGLIGVHVDDGLCTGDEVFGQCSTTIGNSVPFRFQA